MQMRNQVVARIGSTNYLYSSISQVALVGSLLLCFCLLATVDATESPDHALQAWKKPILRSDLHQLIADKQNHIRANINLTQHNAGSKIPRNLWIAFREVPPEDMLPKHITEILTYSRSDNFAINLVDGDHARDLFMETFY